MICILFETVFLFGCFYHVRNERFILTFGEGNK